MKHRSIHRITTLAIPSICTLIIVGCMTQSGQTPQASAEDHDPNSAEEIVGTANKPSNERSRGRGARGSASQHSPAVAGLHGGFMGLQPGSDATALASAEPGEELWIISKPEPDDAGASDDDSSPGSGAMIAHFPGDPDDTTHTSVEVPLPLQHTSVSAAIDGYISAVDVKQRFRNPFDEKIEAVYLFPLPEKSAVSEFVMVIGERRIRGILREKEEAEQIYRAARSQGFQASLLTQHRPNIFEQKVANIEPGKTIDVDIKYFHTLSYDDGWYAFVFPTVVGPRYNPPGSADPIRAVPRGPARAENGATEVQYLRPDERSAHDLSIDVAINAGVVIEELSSSHRITTERPAPESATVTLANQVTIPNRDFVLRFRVAGDTIKSNLLTHIDADSGQGYFTMMLYPPAQPESLTRQAMEMVFVLDCSGSMMGRPLQQAKNAVAAALDELQEGDTFQIIRFSDRSSQFGQSPVPATRENLRDARRYLRQLNSAGGTEMIEGIRAALDFPHDPARLRFVSFMTDGYIGNEADILAAVQRHIGASRIFSFGVGSSVNRFLMERMAKVGRGAVAYLDPQDSARDIMAGFFNRISHPALMDLNIDWGGMAVSDQYPATLPDMFVGRALVVTGKFLGAPDAITVHGNNGSGVMRMSLPLGTSAGSNPTIPKIWARLRIAELADRQAILGDPYDELAGEIKTTALEHQLMSDYTAFVAVDSSRPTDGTHGTRVIQAVPVPDGVRYETTVCEGLLCGSGFSRE